MYQQFPPTRTLDLDHHSCISLEELGRLYYLGYVIMMMMPAYHCKKCGVTEHPRGAIFSCFRGTSHFFQCILTSGVYKVLWLQLGHGIYVLSIFIQALPTEQPPTLVMLLWLLSYFQAYLTLEGIIWYMVQIQS